MSFPTLTLDYHLTPNSYSLCNLEPPPLVKAMVKLAEMADQVKANIKALATVADEKMSKAKAAQDGYRKLKQEQELREQVAQEAAEKEAKVAEEAAAEAKERKAAKRAQKEAAAAAEKAAFEAKVSAKRREAAAKNGPAGSPAGGGGGKVLMEGDHMRTSAEQLLTAEMRQPTIVEEDQAVLEA